MSRLHAAADSYPHDLVVVGSSPAMEHAVSVATTNVKVLITGESGVGKDVFARRLIHSRSARSTERFVALNCAGVAETLLAWDKTKRLAAGRRGCPEDFERRADCT